MSDLLPVDLQPVGPLSQYTSERVARPDAARRSVERDRDSDSVELSAEASRLLELASRPTIRQDLVDRIRAEIEAGVYESDEKINVAISRLAEDL